MIEIKDLRIGNTILFDSEIDSVVSIYSTGVDGEFKSRWSSDRLHGIKLTDEILEKCGFDNIDRTNIYVKVIHIVGSTKLKSLAVYLDENTYTVAIVDYYTGVEKTDLLHLDYKYLHQLQNLYYSLVGIELEIVW